MATVLPSVAGVILVLFLSSLVRWYVIPCRSGSCHVLSPFLAEAFVHTCTVTRRTSTSSSSATAHAFVRRQRSRRAIPIRRTATTACAAGAQSTGSIGGGEENQSSVTTMTQSRRWIHVDDMSSARMPAIIEAYSMHDELFGDIMIDVASYSSLSESYTDDKGVNFIRPTYVRLRPEVPIQKHGEASTSSDFDPDTLLSIQRSDYAAEATLRWCKDFVAALGLCPWAKLSLTTQNAIRIKTVPQSMGIAVFEKVIRNSAIEILRITGHEGYCRNDTDNAHTPDGRNFSHIDPNVAITFIIALPVDCVGSGIEDLPDFEFAAFHDYVYDLEDRLFDEADAIVEGVIGDDDDKHQIPIGDVVTIAPFHPRWKFGGRGEEGGDSVAWEKRTPFPTVSLVRSDAIEAAGEESTSRIASHNEEVLKGMGSHALWALFEDNVLQRQRK